MLPKEWEGHTCLASSRAAPAKKQRETQKSLKDSECEKAQRPLELDFLIGKPHLSSKQHGSAHEEADGTATEADASDDVVLHRRLH